MDKYRATRYKVYQAMYSERDKAWGFREWSEHLTKQEAIKEARKLGEARVTEEKEVYLIGIERKEA